MATNYCISVDWLQVYCTCNCFEAMETFYVDGKVYNMKKKSTVTKLWKEVYSIEWQGREVAILCRAPRSPQLDQFGCTLKLDNRVLYSQSYVTILYGLLRALNLQYKGITRLDLCYDCNYLYGEKRVDEFLMNFFSHAPYCAGHIIRSGSRKVIINATRSNTGATMISGMRWGSPSSDIGAYCYNKSLELIEVKDKPWIREVWEENGLINAWKKEQWDELSESDKKRIIGAGECDTFIECPVWRFEISIKAHAKDLLDINTGELFRLSPEYLNSQAKIEELFMTYAAKVFDFRMSTGQIQIKNYPKLQIFEECQEVTKKPHHVSLFADTGRTEKMIVNKLEELQNTYTDISGVEKSSIEAALQFIRTIAGAKVSIIRKKKELQYLSYMKGVISKNRPVNEYLQFVEWARVARKAIDPCYSLDFFNSLYEACIDQDYRDAANGYTSDLSPVW